MADFNKVNDFVKNAVESMDLSSDQFKVALSNTAPGSETPNVPTADGNGIIGNVTEIDYSNFQNGLTTGLNITTTSSTQTGGTYKLVLADLTLTATGVIPAFQYVYIYDDTVGSPAKPLVGYYDYGSTVNLGSGDTFTIDFSEANGVLQLT